ncbi:MAG: TatD family hydrolase [Bacteroidaceae bacterium]|nr:TatD family hydrolase [Bacteroidaceae bacterium]
MNIFYDIHTHSNCHYENVISVRNVFVSNSIPAELPTLYSASVHPWYVRSDWKKLLEDNIGMIEQSAFIGECGLDKLRSHLDMDEQILLFSEMAQIAERMGKPMIIHCVKAFAELLAVHKQIKPSVPWIIHGFRGKPQQLNQLISKGMYISFGINFNAESLVLCPTDKILFETDEYGGSVLDVYRKASEVTHIPLETLVQFIAHNYLEVKK